MVRLNLALKIEESSAEFSRDVYRVNELTEKAVRRAAGPRLYAVRVAEPVHRRLFGAYGQIERRLEESGLAAAGYPVFVSRPGT